MSHIEEFLNLVTTFALGVALTIFLILILKLRGRERSIMKSLKFQLTVVITFMLAAELSLPFLESDVASYSSASSSGVPTTFDILHSLGMGFFAALMTWRATKFLR